jgi:ankyrin repeat protein
VRSRPIILPIIFSVAAFGADGTKAPLAGAVQRQDSRAVRALLEQHPDVNAPLADGSTALLWAAHWDDAALVDQLLRAGASAKTANRYGISPLLEACVNGDAAIIGKLLDAGADPNTAQPEGETALMTASRTGNADAVAMLLDHGARVNAKENWRGQSALMWAAAEKHPAVVELLIQRGADVNARSAVFDFTQLRPKEGSVPMNYPRDGFTALLFAARVGDLESGQALVNAKADVNLGDPDGITPLIEAIVNFHFDFAGFLLDRGADPNASDGKGRSPLYAAVDMHTLDTSTRPSIKPPDKLDSLDVIKALLAHGANPNAQLIDYVAPRGPLDVADYSMGAGATPFLRAAKAADLEVIRLLLDKGANPLLATTAHMTALMAAAGLGWRDGKSHGAEPDAIEAIKLCLDLGLDIDAATDEGETALQGASQRGADTVVSYLISRGADVTAKDKKGHTALRGEHVQTFAAQWKATGTSTAGLYPSVPATVTCKDCSGSVKVSSSVPWIVITSVTGGSVNFNVFSNTKTSPRLGVIQITQGENTLVTTMNQEASAAPALHRQVAFLYQRTLGREPDPAGFAFWTGPGAPSLGRMTADFLDSAEGQDSDFEVIAMHQAINGSAPGYRTYLAALEALRNGTTAESQFAAILGGSPCSGSAQATVECLYENMLGRAPTSSEISAGIPQQPFLLFASLLTGPEFQSTGGFTADHTNSLYVTMLFYLILEREPKASELASWLSVANGGGPGIYYNQRPEILGPGSTQLQILGNGQSAGFTGSAEFLAGFR